MTNGATRDRQSFLGESWRAWLALAIGVLAVSAHSASSLAMSVLMKPMLESLQIDRTVFASAMTLRMLTMVFAISMAGHLTDRMGARAVLAGGALVVGFGTLGLSSVGSLAGLYPVMAVLGPGQAAIGSVAASALVLRLFRHRRGLAVGVLNGGDNLLNSTVPIASAALLGLYGWRGAVAGLGAAYLFLAVLIWAALRARDGRSEPVGESPGEPPRPGRWGELPWGSVELWMLVAAYSAIYAFITSVQFHFHAYQTDSGLNPAQASRLLSLQVLVGALGSPLFGWMAERISPRRTLVIVTLGLIAGAVMLWTFHGEGSFTVWAVFYGIVNSGVVAILALVITELFGDLHIGRLMGLTMMFCMGSTMLGNLFSAAVFDHLRTYVPVWQAYTVLLCLALLPVVGLARRRPVLDDRA